MRTHLSSLGEWCTLQAGIFFWFRLLLSEESRVDVGMFFWFELLLGDDPAVEGDSLAVAQDKAVERGVLALPGTVFLPNGRKTAYARASFSLLGEEDEDVDDALNRLGKVISEARGSR